MRRNYYRKVEREMSDFEKAEWNKWKEKIKEAFEKMYGNDSELITKSRVCERCLMFRFALYLYPKLPDGLDLDCEYDKHGVDPKGIMHNGTRTLISPDIIIHKRGNDVHNYVMIELKKNKAKGITHDYEKLAHCTEPPINDGDKYRYGYRFGVSIIIKDNVKETMDSCKVFMGGKRVL